MRHISSFKIFEANTIDKEEIELLFVDLIDEDFQVVVSKLLSGIKVHINHNKYSFDMSEINETILFARDLISRKYDMIPYEIKINSTSNKIYDGIDDLSDFEKSEDFEMTDVQYVELYFLFKRESEKKQSRLDKFLNRFKSETNDLIITNHYGEAKYAILQIPYNKKVKFFVEDETTYNNLLQDENINIIQLGKKEQCDNGFYVEIVRHYPASDDTGPR